MLLKKSNTRSAEIQVSKFSKSATISQGCPLPPHRSSCCSCWSLSLGAAAAACPPPGPPCPRSRPSRPTSPTAGAPASATRATVWSSLAWPGSAVTAGQDRSTPSRGSALYRPSHSTPPSSSGQAPLLSSSPFSLSLSTSPLLSPPPEMQKDNFFTRARFEPK